jgi:hypothetical protein
LGLKIDQDERDHALGVAIDCRPAGLGSRTTLGATIPNSLARTFFRTSQNIFRMFLVIVSLSLLAENAEGFLEKRKTDRFSKDKTHKKLTVKILLGISLPVAKVTAFETSEGIGEQSGDILGESSGRAVCGCY